MVKALKQWWPGTELNRRRQPFQGCALPPELPGHFPTHTFPPAVNVLGCRRRRSEEQSKRWEVCDTRIIATSPDSLNLALAPSARFHSAPSSRSGCKQTSKEFPCNPPLQTTPDRRLCPVQSSLCDSANAVPTRR